MQIQREHISLDGQWDFIHDAQGGYSLSDVQALQAWQAIQVPMPWQAQSEAWRWATGIGWYRRIFDMPIADASGAVILHFGAVFYHAEAWLNGHYLGADENGYLPFEFDITPYLEAHNMLFVRVTLPSDDRRHYPDYPFTEILHGKQGWYGYWGGIWQSVWLEHRALCHIEHISIAPDVASRSVACVIECSDMPQNLDFSASIIAPNGEQVGHTRGTLTHQRQAFTLTLADAPLLWSPDAPHLYHVRVTLTNGDVLEKSCGFRTIEARDGQILLNGEPFYMRGALDQDYYPDTISTPPSSDFIRDHMLKAKAMGLNTLRYHVKIADPRYYAMADQLGLLIWVDLPMWTHFTPRLQGRIKVTFERMLRRDGHHPSIAIWTIVNEDWGTDLVHNADHRAWLLDTFAWLKAQDETRLVVDNSPCVPNFHLKSDLDDYHFYRAIPDHAHEWDEFVSAFAERQAFTYSPHGDAIRTQSEPLIVSEFGNWGLPDVTDLLKTGDEPWWFETGHDWAEGIVYPHGMDGRFEQWHFDHTFGTLQNLIHLTQWQQYEALKYQIESMRLRPEIQGYVITEMTDVHWECNGLLDLWRNPRIFHEQLADLNADTLLIARSERHSYWANERVTVQLALSQIGRQDARKVAWYIPQTSLEGTIMLEDGDFMGVRQLEPLAFTLPDVPKPTYIRLVFDVLNEDGGCLGSNHLDWLILPTHEVSQRPLKIDSPQLAEQFRALGYHVVSGDVDAPLITQHLDADLQDHIWRGGSGLLLINEDSGLPVYQSGTVIQQQFPYVSLSPRHDTIWQGDWVSSFSWLRSADAFADLPDKPLMNASFAPVIAPNVMLGCTPQDYQEVVLGGLFVGWLHRPSATVVRRAYGEGTVYLTTLNLLQPALDGVPIARYLVNQLVEAL